MTPSTVRTFDDREATREAVPLITAVVGASGTGKTLSAIRLATGIARIVGGVPWVVDTEARRALLYADKWKFRHVPFGPPFSSLDYKAVIEHCAAKGAKVVVIDQLSFEHEGEGGMLDEHAHEVQRLMAAWGVKREDAVNWPAYQRPKAKRKQLIQALITSGLHFVLCFRAREKSKPGKDANGKSTLVDLGWQAIGGDDLFYETSVRFLLMPGADGVPSWKSELPGEMAIMRKPLPLREMLAEAKQIDEALGEKLARWAAGTPATTTAPSLSTDDVVDMLARYTACSEAATFRVLEDERQKHWAALGKDPKAALKTASDAAKKRIDSPADAPEPGSAG